MRKLLALILLCPLIVLGEDVDTNLVAQIAELAKVASTLKYQSGEVTLQGGLAKIALPPEFKYLGPEDAEKVLVEMWGNPPGQDTLGMIVPTNVSLLNPECWAVVIQYEEDGYVSDSDADSIDYKKLLKEMQAATKQANKKRKAAGYPGMELIGWATPPRYDKAAHKLYWAKELKSEGAKENTLNYNIRVLGRRGVLILNAVASMTSFPEIEKQTPDIVTMVEFNDGHKYSEFNSKTDKTAAYGIAALVAGGIAAKAGFFKMLWLGILAFKKLLIVGIIAIGAFIKKLFSKNDTSNY